ncbi:hypothetical protein EC991_001923 [Linnemannia zychae]|nr:hypothetical protein EC991_001923 [Linnemannia zychae]
MSSYVHPAAYPPASTSSLPTITGSLRVEQARQLNKHNAERSLLISLPPELLKNISYYLTNPLDLLRFSYACHELFYLTAPADWFSLATYTYSKWIKSCGRADERDWKEMVLKDAALGARLGAVLPALPTTSPPPQTSSVTTARSTPSALPPTPTAPIADVTSTSIVSASPRPKPQCPESKSIVPLQVKLSEAQVFKTDEETRNAEGAPWVRMGSPNYNIDRETRTVIAASMITRPKSVSASNSAGGGDTRPHEHEILFYNLPDLTNPIARCGSEVWEKDKANTSLPWYHPFTRDMMQVAQVVEIKHYPKTVVLGNMRVVIVIAFGQRARPLVNNTPDSHILGVWLMLKVIEVWVPAHPQATLTKSMMNHFCADPSVDVKTVKKCLRINPEDVVNFESLEPRQNQITMHGRIVKLYSADTPQLSEAMDVDAREKVDCIAIFGTQNSDMASAMVIKKVLFRDGPRHGDLGRKTYSNKAVSRGVSCMTLFPDHSDYEHLLVLFNQHGRGMVWDWVNEKQITQLHMMADKVKADPPQQRTRVYYWGVQVSPALEVSFPDELETGGNTKHKAFRIVTMADGAEDEWESCWWNITHEELREPMTVLRAPPIIERREGTSTTPATQPLKTPLFSEVKRFERETYGACLPEQETMHAGEHGRPIQFIAYVVWNHYRIGLSSRMGICMMDLGEPESESQIGRQWITFLEEREDLIDIAIFGHNLVVTLKTGHLVWSFYGQEKAPFVAQKDLGLRMDNMVEADTIISH